MPTSIYTPYWAIPPIWLALSGRNSRKIPERPWKRSQSVSWNSHREYGWDPPNPIIQGISGFQHFQTSLLPQYGWGRLFFQKWFRRGPLRAGHGIPSSTEGISDLQQTLEEGRGTTCIRGIAVGSGERAPMAFPDSSSVLDKFQSARSLARLAAVHRQQF